MSITALVGDGSRKLFAKDDDGFERVVIGEILVPYQKDVFGDVFNPEAIKRFAYRFMIAGINAGKANGIGLDVEHDNIDYTGKYFIVQSYIAGANDPHFTEGAWVVASWIPDDALWQDVLDGKLNGYSYEAFTLRMEVDIEGDFDVYAVGETEEDPVDGHKHRYFCILDDNGRVVVGGTSEIDGHTHDIVRHSVTNTSLMHNHRFNLTKNK